MTRFELYTLHSHICLHSIVLNGAQGKFYVHTLFQFMVHLLIFSYQIRNFMPSIPDLELELGKVSLMWHTVPSDLY
jgi:hypothetical protein